MDRFRRSLSESETLLIINGYSFGDEHLNELIFDAATQHPRSEVLALCFSKVPETLKAHAFRTPNLSVLSAELAVVGGRERHWSKEEDIPGLYEGTRFLLGDFARLSSFLAGKRFEADVENQR